MTIATQNPSVLPTMLHFEGAELRVIDRDGQPWFTAVDLSRALGYVKDQHVSSIYQRNQREFKPSMTQVISLQPNEINESPKLGLPKKSNGNLPYKARIFSLRGAHLIGMFAQTAKAAAFRSWVLDVLEGITSVPVQAGQPPVPAGQFLPALIADSISGPALSEIPAILAACGQRLSGAMCLPHWQSAPAPSELADVVTHSRSLTRSQLDAITLAAVSRLMRERGAHGVQQMLREVNSDFLLVNESELSLSLYRARSLPQGAV